MRMAAGFVIAFGWLSVGVGTASAAWDNVFQTCCNGCRSAPRSSFFAPCRARVVLPSLINSAATISPIRPTSRNLFTSRSRAIGPHTFGNPSPATAIRATTTPAPAAASRWLRRRLRISCVRSAMLSKAMCNVAEPFLTLPIGSRAIWSR